MLNAIKFLFYTELLLLWRRSQEWLYPIAFFLIVISLFPLAFTPDPVFLQKFAPGCIWIAALLSSLLSVETLFLQETEEGITEQWLFNQIPLTVIVFIKLSAQWLATQLPLIILTPLLGFIFHLSFITILVLCLSLLLGTPILILLGGLGVTLTLGLRQQGVLLGLIILPLVIPVLILGVTIVQQVSVNFIITPIMIFLMGVMFAAITLLPKIIAITLQMSLDS